MPISHLTSREFNQDLARAKRQAESGPVVVTDRGTPAYVLMTHAAYRELVGERGGSIVDMLAQPEDDGADDFQPVILRDLGLKPAEPG
jgi:hypothetical protein